MPGASALPVLRVAPADHPELLALWEESVRATHSFMAETDIQALKPLILHEYFSLVDLYVLRGAGGELRAFMGVAEDRLEMLFVRPDCLRQGLGGRLARYALEELGVRAVDVNEQSPDALAFYQRLGFRVKGRSEMDDQGWPYPLLHLSV